MKTIFKFMSLLYGTVGLLAACSGNIDNNGGTDGGDDDGTRYEELDVKYYKQLLVTEFTAAACINCPTMAVLLEEVEKQNPGQYAMTALHIPYGGKADQFCIPIAVSYAQKLNVDGLPVGFVDLRKECEFNAEKSSLDNAVSKALAHTAMCGVAIVSDYDASDRSLAVTARITSNKHREYRYLIILTESGIGGDNFVVRAVVANSVYGEKLNKGNALVPGEEAEGMRRTTIEPSWNTDNMKIIVAALVSEDDGLTWVCDNVAMCGVGEKVDYKYVKD